MNEQGEKYRLRNFLGTQPPQQLHLKITFKCNNVEKCVANVIKVIEIIAQFGLEDWPNDEYWKQQLPDWLLKTFKVYSAEELAIIMADKSTWANLQWTLGSWLDRIRDRQWEWWSVQLTSDYAIAYVIIQSYPTSIAPLEYLIKASGGEEISIE